MALAGLPAAAQPHELGPAPLVVPWDLRLTPETFERVCQANPEAMLKLAADGPGAGAWIAFDSSTGFRLADGSVLSPDLSLLRR